MHLSKHSLRLSALLLIALSLSNCALTSSSSRILYQQGRNVVRLEPDPLGTGPSAESAKAYSITIDPDDLIKVLRGITINGYRGLLSSLLSLPSPSEPVFRDEELEFLAPIFSKTLEQARPSERVAFTYWSTISGRRSAPLSGTIAVREPYLWFSLNDHPTVGWQDPEDPSSPKLFELEFARQGYLLPESEQEQKTAYKTRPVIQIEYRRYLASLQDRAGPTDSSHPAASPVPPRPDVGTSDSQTLKELQSQLNDLAESNQKLLKASSAQGEELARLRRELAETKQLLADKVLELNRLKNKARKAQ